VAPQYAQHLVQVNGLPDDYVPILAQYDGRTQDRLVKDFALQHRRNVEAKSTMDAQTEQRLRDLEAQIKQQSGGFTPSSTGSGSPPAQSDRPTDPRAREVWDYLHAGQ
jgi:cytochrome c553